MVKRIGTPIKPDFKAGHITSLQQGLHGDSAHYLPPDAAIIGDPPYGIKNGGGLHSPLLAGNDPATTSTVAPLQSRDWGGILGDLISPLTHRLG